MFILQESPIDVTLARNSFADHLNGALVNFEGVVRADVHDGLTVSGLTYFADVPACNTEGSKILAEAMDQFSLTNAICIQRTGKVEVGESAVWIAAWSGHRDAAFQGCRYIIEETKKRLLIWKKEQFTDGSSKWIHGKETLTLGRS